MTWLTPIAGLALASVTLPLLLALYFLKLRRRKRQAPTTLLWRRAVEDLRANAPFQRLRPSWLLLLQLLVLTLVALAVMQPRMDLGATRGGRVVLFIDHSASMNTIDVGDGITRLDEAKRLAKERIRRLMSGGLFSSAPSEVMVIAFGDRAEIRSPFSSEMSQVLAAVDAIEPTDTTTSITDAFALARAFATQVDPDKQTGGPEQPASLELFSDGRIPDLAEQTLRAGEKLHYTMIGKEETTNAGIETVAGDRSVEKPAEIEVFAAIRNWGSEPASGDVQLAVDGNIKGVTPKPLEVPAQKSVAGGRAEPGTARLTFRPFEQPRAGSVEVQWLAPDPYMVDNRAFLVTPAAKRLRVALVGDASPLIKTLLEGLALSELRSFSCAEFDSQTADGSVSPERFDAVVINGCWPKKVPPGRYLAFGLPDPGQVVEFNPFGEKNGVAIHSMKREHPVLRAVNLDDVVIAKMTATAPGSEVEILAEAMQGPVICFVQRGGVQALVATFDPLDSNWPFHRSFVNFIANSLDWLGQLGDPAIGGSLAPGETLTTRLPPDAKDVSITLPDGKKEPVPAPDPAQVTWGPIRRAGIHTLAWTSHGVSEQRLFAVNMLDANEARVAAVKEVTIGTERVEGHRGGSGILTDLWPWALGGCLLLLAAEWWVYHRRHWM